MKQPAGGRELDLGNRTRNALLRSLRCLGERAFALLTQRWRTLQHITASPSKITADSQSRARPHPLRARLPQMTAHYFAEITSVADQLYTDDDIAEIMKAGARQPVTSRERRVAHRNYLMPLPAPAARSETSPGEQHGVRGEARKRSGSRGG